MGFTAVCEKGVVQKVVDFTYVYRALLLQVTRMFETGKAPLDLAETIEIVAFMEAALESSRIDVWKVALAV
jgi:hypothetical protein